MKIRHVLCGVLLGCVLGVVVHRLFVYRSLIKCTEVSRARLGIQTRKNFPGQRLGLMHFWLTGRSGVLGCVLDGAY